LNDTSTRSDGQGPRARAASIVRRHVGDSERRSVRLKDEAGVERTGIDRVESESIDELHHSGDRGAVVAGRGEGDAIRRAPGTPVLFEVVVAELVEALDHSGRREPVLYDHAGAVRRGGEFFVDAIDRFPVVHRVDEDLAGEQVAWQLAKAVRRNGEDDQVCMSDSLVGFNRVSAGSEHLDGQRDAIGSSRP
jgi:hypothetical protein